VAGKASRVQVITTRLGSYGEVRIGAVRLVAGLVRRGWVWSQYRRRVKQLSRRTRRARRKLAAHDRGDDRHSKSVSFVSKVTRLATERVSGNLTKVAKRYRERGTRREGGAVERIGLNPEEWV
jgi:hypothetical protein